MAPLGSAPYGKKVPSAPYEDDDSSYVVVDIYSLLALLSFRINWTGLVYFGLVCFVFYLLYLTLSGPRPGNEGDRFHGGACGYPGGPPGPGGNPPPPGFSKFYMIYIVITLSYFRNLSSEL